jgi:hypothetical protein
MMTDQDDEYTPKDYDGETINDDAPAAISYFKMAIAVGVVAAVVLALFTMF